MRKILCLILLCMTVLGTAAVSNDMKFRRLDTRDGLSNTQTNCIYRDSKGLVWVGTPYGLNRYDGYRVRTYYAHTKDTTTLLRSFIDDIQEAPDGSLWLRHGPEYSVFYAQEEKCMRHPEQWLHSQGIQGSIERVYIDRHRQFWVKTYDQGFWFLNIDTHQVRHFPVGTGSQQIRRDMSVSDFEEHGNSLLAISNNGDIVCFHTKEGRISWKSSRLRNIGAPRNVTYNLHVDSHCNIWVMADVSAYVYLQQQRRWVTSVKEALRIMGVTDMPEQLVIWDVATDLHGRLWLATDHEGLCIANLHGGPMLQYLSVKNDETTISDNTLRRIYRDKQNRMWIATYKNGVNYYTDNLFNFKHIALGNVNTVCVDRQGRCWAGTNDHGIVCYDPKTGKHSFYNKSNSQLGSDVIVSSLESSDGTMWFGTYEGGLICYRDGNFVTLKATGASDGLANNSIWALTEDWDGNLWLGTLGGGVQRMDRHSGHFTTLTQENANLANNYISSLQLTHDGQLLVGHGEFYSWINPKTLKVENKTIEEQHSDIPVTRSSNIVLQDSRGLIWQGTASGATVCDTVTQKSYLLDMKSGLVGSTVNGIVEDSLHVMWVVTEHGISSVLPKKDDNGKWSFLIHSFNNRDGLQEGPYNQRSVVLAPDGRIIVGGYDGIDIVNPKKMLFEQSLHEIPMFSGVKILDRSVMNIGDELHLEYAENQFVIQLCSNSGEVHNRARFAYRLENFSNQWSFTEETRPDISFMGLPSGHYKLSVRMLQNDGIMGPDEVQLPIVIAAPWYRSWWMYMVYLLLAAVAIVWLYRRSQEKLRLERLKMEQESSHRFDELKQKFAENVTDELHLPFQQTFESLNAMMQRETDELRYEQEQQVFTQVENLLEEVSKLTEQNQMTSKLKPQVREIEIESLDEKLVKAATDYVENNLDNVDISVETMAEAMNMSRVHLYKRLTAITGLSPSEFIRQIRLRYAEQLLSRSQLTVAEVAYKVGFNNPRYFSKYFKAMYGVMPSEYKNKGKNETGGN